MKLLFAPWMQELDAETINGIGIPSIVLMENASKGAADFFESEFPLTQYKNTLVVAGKGNNGGDGFAAGRILFQKGYNVEFIVLTNPEKLNPDPKINFDILQKLNLKVSIIENENQLKDMKRILDNYHRQDSFIIDALFGTGLNKPVKPGLYSGAIRLISESLLKIAAVDIPSGLSDDFLPEEGEHITADVTATFQAIKTAHLHPDGNTCCGKIKIIDIGIPKHLIEREKYYIRLIEPKNFKQLFNRRKIDSHKGTYGHSLTICGSIEKPGAGILSSYAVLRSGAGLCTAAVCYENRTIPVTVHPELMTMTYENVSDLQNRMDDFNSVLIGPGLGNSKESAGIVKGILEKVKVPLIMDADALNVLNSDDLEFLKKQKREFPVIMTPHPGEFSRLTGRTTTEVGKKRIILSRQFAMETNVYLILKGHHTIIATPDGKVFVNQSGNAGMATAGSGDVLSGMIAGMVSQFFKGKSSLNLETLETVLQAAVFIHGYAGDLAAGELGEICLTAGDIIDSIPNAIHKIDEFKSVFQFAG